MTHRPCAAVLAVAVALTAASPAFATPSPARQIRALRAQVARDNATIKALRHTISAPITTAAQAWTEIASLVRFFAPWSNPTSNCGENYAVLPQLMIVPGVQVYSSYTFAQSDITGQPWCP